MKSLNHKIAAWIFLGLGSVGFLDSLYLSVKKIFASQITCFIFENCDNVLNSSYANIFGIPLSFYGVIFYLVMIVFTVRFLETRKEKTFKIVYYLAIFGLIFAVYLFILQAFIIKAFCIYCLTSAVVSLALFITAVFASKKIQFS